MSKPILTRIAITEAEWVSVRQHAIGKGVTTSQLLAEIVRKHLGLKAAKP